MNKLDQLKANLQFWENLALKSHWIVAISILPVILWDHWWTVVGVAISGAWMIFLFWKHMSARHKVDTFGRDD